MATTLEMGKQLKRLVSIHGVGMVEVTISEDGVVMRVPKTLQRLRCMWGDVVGAMQTPDNAPPNLRGEPLKFLVHEAKKVANRSRRLKIRRDDGIQRC